MRFIINLMFCAALTVHMAAAEEPWDGKEPWLERTHAIGQIETMPEGRLNAKELDQLIDVGDALFKAKFTINDGAGRPMATQAILPTKARRERPLDFVRTSGPDAASCVACHNEPFVGGAGDFVTNVFVSEGFTNADFDSTDPQFSNERGTNHLFGAGLIELLAREMSADLIAVRQKALFKAKESGVSHRAELLTKGVSFGHITALPDGLVELSEIEGVDNDLVIRPFTQKGVMTSLRQFTVNATNHHHGIQATERFGVRWTGERDFDEDAFEDEFSHADVSALVAWQASLRPPFQVIPDNKIWHEAAAQGADMFSNIGCAECHRTSLPLNSLEFFDPGPLDVAGTLQINQVETTAIYDLALLDWAKTLPQNEKGAYLIPLFGDLKRHVMTDQEVDAFGNELMSQRFVDRNIFITAELWGLASTAPFGHRNDMGTLDEVIRAHGGASRASRDAYVEATQSEKNALIAYLKTLEISDE